MTPFGKTARHRFQALGRKQISIGPALLGVALTLGFLLRLGAITLHDFPLRDGGLFVTMARDLRSAAFELPMYSSFNSGDVPFAYPPLGLYILAAVPGDPISTERWLPLVWSMLSITMTYALARELLDEKHAGVAAILFAAMPAAWGIEGAGIARALGLALLLAALWRFSVALRHPTALNAVVVGLLGGLAMLSHPGVGPTAAVSGLTLLIFRPSPRGAAMALAAAGIALLVIAPWLAMVLDRYGAESLIAAAQAHRTDEALGVLLTAGPSRGGALDPIFPLALLGSIVSIHRREWLLPAWVVVSILVPGGDGRHATAVWAMLAATGLLLVARSVAELGATRLAASVGLAWLLVTAILPGYQSFTAIPAPVRQAMVEAGRSTSADTTFAVVVRSSDLVQPILDWFPELSRRVSLGTSMGLEWTPDSSWDETVALNRAIQRGVIPPSADAVFIVDGSNATWELVR